MQCNPVETAHVAAADPQVSGTLDRDEYHRKYLLWIAECQRNGDLLHHLFLRRKDGPERDAIWEGYWALKAKCEDFVRKARDRGVLLHIGVSGALQ